MGDEREWTINQINADLRNLGVRPGGVLLAHSSLRAFGQIPGGAETVILAIRAALGAEGTLLMPALTYARVTPENPVFDVRQTPSNVGIVAETFRLTSGVQRSLHPTHSVCAQGRLVSALIGRHDQDRTPCGPNSPFHILPEVKGQILMLGCGLEPNTSMHAIEELVEPAYLYDPPIQYRLILADGQTIDKAYTPHNFRGWRQHYERIEGLMSRAGLRRGTVLQAQAYLIDAGELWERAEQALRRDALYFVDPVEGA